MTDAQLADYYNNLTQAQQDVNYKRWQDSLGIYDTDADYNWEAWNSPYNTDDEPSPEPNDPCCYL